MNIVKKLSIIFVLFITIAFQVGIVNAASSINVGFTSNSSTLNKGSEVQLYINISDINVGEGVNVVKANIEYDKNVLQYEGITANNGWSATLNENTGIMIINNLENLINTNQRIATLKFKVKENTTATSTTVSLSNIESSNADEKVTHNNVSVRLTINSSGNIGSGNSGSGNNGSGNNGSGNNGSGNNGGNSGSNGSLNGSNSQQYNSNNNLPQTGIMDGVFIIATIVVVIIAGTISFIMYRRYRGV